MKQYLIPIVTILVLILGMIGGCSQKPEQVHEPSSKDTLTPRVIEKDVEIKYDWRGRGVLPFYLKVGDRVEGEVSIYPIDNGGRFELFVVAEVIDPYGNMPAQTWHSTQSGGIGSKSFPWRFAFIAYTDGEYELSVYFKDQVQGLTPSAHLKITIYEGD